jgi:hypothetical protein
LRLYLFLEAADGVFEVVGEDVQHGGLAVIDGFEEPGLRRDVVCRPPVVDGSGVDLVVDQGGLVGGRVNPAARREATGLTRGSGVGAVEEQPALR